jgi:hypothetical protein
MTIGRLFAIKPAALTNTSAYTPTAGKLGSFILSCCNQGSSSDTVRVALCSGAIGTLAATDYIEYNAEIPPGGNLERTGVLAYDAQSLIVYSTTGTTSFVGYGLED